MARSNSDEDKRFGLVTVFGGVGAGCTLLPSTSATGGLELRVPTTLEPLRVPKAFADEIGARDGKAAEMTVSDGKLVIEIARGPQRRKRRHALLVAGKHRITAMKRLIGGRLSIVRRLVTSSGSILTPASVTTAVVVLREMAQLNTEGFVFPAPKDGSALSDVAVARALDAAGGEGATPHGMRSTFRDWAGGDSVPVRGDLFQKRARR